MKEIKSGQKESHWIWYIFPQLYRLGSSYASKYYGIRGEEEAKAYLAHPVLGRRLREITSALLALPDKNPAVVMEGTLDAKKLQSSMTLFAYISDEGSVFHKVLDKYFNGQKDQQTVRMLDQQKGV